MNCETAKPTIPQPAYKTLNPAAKLAMFCPEPIRLPNAALRALRKYPSIY